MWRWRNTGARATDGTLVKLECVRVGGRWLTSRGAVARFVSALTDASTSVESSPIPRSPAQRRKALAVTDKKLDAMLA
ncbi:MAG: hypothetical protein K8U57_31410 [Planctomycetes bacterium]|nr:hypothetical protein [Planctomycetota bacterium]